MTLWIVILVFAFFGLAAATAEVSGRTGAKLPDVDSGRNPSGN